MIPMNDDTLEALYRTICQKPLEDTPRLEYADRLDELDITEENLQAKYIRVSIDIAHPPKTSDFTALAEWKHKYEWCKRCITINGTRWCNWKCPNEITIEEQTGISNKCTASCTICKGTGDLFRSVNTDTRLSTFDNFTVQSVTIESKRIISYRKGFPVQVNCISSDVYSVTQVQCKRCEGRKYGYGPTGSYGMITCAVCNNTGQVTELRVSDWAKAIVTQTPITQFKCTNLHPYALRNRAFGYSKITSAINYTHTTIWDRLSGEVVDNNITGVNLQGTMKIYTTREGAEFDLATVIGTMVRQSVYGENK